MSFIHKYLYKNRTQLYVPVTGQYGAAPECTLCVICVRVSDLLLTLRKGVMTCKAEDPPYDIVWYLGLRRVNPLVQLFVVTESDMTVNLHDT